MFTTFHNVSFIASTVTGLEVEGNSLHILTTGRSYEVRFKNQDEANAGLVELTKILNGNSKSTATEQEAPRASKTASLKDALTSGLDRLQGFTDGLKATAADKAQEAVLNQIFGKAGASLDDIFSTKDSLVARATSWIEQLEKALDEVTPEQKPMATRNAPKAESTEDVAPASAPEAKPVPPKSKPEKAVKTSCFDNVSAAASIIDTDGIFADNIPKAGEPVQNAKKLTIDEFKLVFGTSSEPLIGDLSERQLREFVSEFLDNALTNERVQELYNNIKEHFGEEEAESAINGYKELILTISLQNTEMTLSQIIERYFS